MDLNCKSPELESIIPVLRGQLTDTLRLRAHVRHAEANFSDRSGGVVDLLRCMSRELWTLSKLIDWRASACEHRGTGLIRTTTELLRNEDNDGNLGSLLNHFCTYARNTSERLAVASKWNERETADLLDRVLSVANAGIWFLDIYSNAIWLKCRLSSLPKWALVSSLRQIPVN